MTERIFDDAPLLGQLTANITSLEPCPQGFRVTLDQTIFFPRGGGQPCEAGSIDGCPVTDVYEEEGQIFHILCQQPAHRQGVECRIDLEGRRDHMQQHSGQHVISAAAQQLFDNPTLIARIEEETSHIEFAQPMTEEQLAALQLRVDEVVAQRLPIRCTYHTPEEAARLPVRGKITPHERIRLVDIEGFDLNACGGTHCPDTGMIGPVRWTGSKMVRGAFRLYFRAGQRALADSLEKDLRQLRLGALLEVESGPEAEENITALHTRAAFLEEEVRRLRQQLLEAEGDALVHRARPTAGGVAAYRLLEGWNNKEIKALCDRLTKEHPILLFLACRQGEDLSLMVCQPKQMKGFHPGQQMKEFFASHGGRGGGSALLAQGMVPYSPQALADFEALAHSVMEE